MKSAAIVTILVLTAFGNGEAFSPLAPIRCNKINHQDSSFLCAMKERKCSEPWNGAVVQNRKIQSQGLNPTLGAGTIIEKQRENKLASTCPGVNGVVQKQRNNVRTSKKQNIGRTILVECKDEQESRNVEADVGRDAEAEEDYEEDEEEIAFQKRRRAAMAARLLQKGGAPTRSRSGSVSESKVKNAAARNTSVGTRREGSASKARSRSTGARGGGLGGKILRGVRTAAAAKNKSKNNDGNPNTSEGTLAVKKNVIQSTIDVLIETQNELQSMGILGEKSYTFEPNNVVVAEKLFDLPTKPLPGSILLDRTKSNPNDSLLSKQRISDNTVVRVGTQKDDLEIAKLRLSVFSDFSPEVRRQFRTRSCEVLDNRRMKGATCLVASVDYTDAGMEYKMNEDSLAHSWIIGSVECSTIEFSGTQLGDRRPSGSVLYITEVAVSPRARRTGAGTKLLKGIDELAKIRGVETLYLHVDVTNTGAFDMYKKSGYEILDPKDPLYNEFTYQLNLHDGATKGRNHHFLHKKMTKQQTWLGGEPKAERKTQGFLGFDVPDLV